MPQEERASRIDAIVKLERHEPVTLERLQAGAFSTRGSGEPFERA